MATKSGFLYVFNRVSGEPLLPIEERPVPKSDVPGEVSWPTQPVPTKPPPFALQKLTADNLNPYLDEAEKDRIRGLLQNADTRGVFIPFSLARDVVQVPGDDGGANWGVSAADPETGMVYVRSGDGAQLKRMSATPPASAAVSNGFPGATKEQIGHLLFNANCQGCHGPDRGGVADPKVIGVDRFKKIVTNGEGEMPSFSYISSENLDALASFIANPEAGNLPPGVGRGGGANQSALVGGGNAGDRLPYPPGQLRFYTSYGGRIAGPGGLPASAPPWNTVTAYDLNLGTIKWQILLGTVPYLVAKGFKNTGQIKAAGSNRNGPVVTAGGC